MHINEIRANQYNSAAGERLRKEAIIYYGINVKKIDSSISKEENKKQPKAKGNKK